MLGSLAGTFSRPVAGLAAYAANGFTPALVIADADQVYADSGTVRASIGDVVTHTRASTATRTNSSGELETVSSGTLRTGHHLYLSGAWTRAGVLVEDARTNSCAVSRNVGGTGWSSTGTPTIATDETGIFGDANAAQTITDDDGAAFEFVLYTVSVANNSNPAVVSTFFKKTVSASSFPGLQALFINGSSQVISAVTVNTDTGTLTARTGGPITAAPLFSAVEDCGDWWRVSLAVQNNSTGNNTFRMDILPAVATTDTDTWDSTLTGSCVLDGHQIEVGHAEPTSFILTSGSTATRAADALTVADTKVPAIRALGIKGYLTYVDRGVAAQVELLQREVDANNRIRVYLDTDGAATGEVNAEQVDGGTVDVATAGDYTPGVNVPIRIVSRHTATEVQVAKDGTAGTANTTPTTIDDLATAAMEILPTGASLTVTTVCAWADDPGEAGIEGWNP